MCECILACYAAGVGQMTWRASDQLLDRVRQYARRHGRSLNDYVTAVLDAATSPDLASDEAERLRERLAAAGLLVPPGPPTVRPDPDEVERARAKAGLGTPLSEIVDRDRGD
jgi:hypothetical protein